MLIEIVQLEVKEQTTGLPLKYNVYSHAKPIFWDQLQVSDILGVLSL